MTNSLKIWKFRILIYRGWLVGMLWTGGWSDSGEAYNRLKQDKDASLEKFEQL